MENLTLQVTITVNTNVLTAVDQFKSPEQFTGVTWSSSKSPRVMEIHGKEYDFTDFRGLVEPTTKKGDRQYWQLTQSFQDAYKAAIANPAPVEAPVVPAAPVDQPIVAEQTVAEPVATMDKPIETADSTNYGPVVGKGKKNR